MIACLVVAQNSLATENTPDQNIQEKVDSSASVIKEALGKPSQEPFGVGADMAGGYAAQVLETLLLYWDPPTDSSGVLQILLRLSNNGRLLFCETKKSSGNTALDESPCLAALKPESFGIPPSGTVSEVWLTLATDRQALFSKKATPSEKKLSYAEKVMQAVRPHIELPLNAENSGKYTVDIRLRVLQEKESGRVEQVTVSKSSGKGDIDAAILAAVCTPGILPIPSQKSVELRLSFTVNTN